uniref:Uncharacterized protein n=1 Tax=Arundo donax TaxID=35708 RepID=A0A0A8YC36_ARUDO
MLRLLSYQSIHHYASSIYLSKLIRISLVIFVWYLRLVYPLKHEASDMQILLPHVILGKYILFSLDMRKKVIYVLDWAPIS